ncbi:PD-(D/E)XK nuclease family protein [Neorhizobium alkalisoli]|uniref:PD-(D/E)XK nuclease superfamily protein n=1 Tax=Neorhizobium alkalisoli TaxID=528178 RepID=A0A561Q7F4_9HYPH|nr:PD-(D/E)XK nuclease family protein [Neorhizobium alkalisoli]TWF46306.1 hypothetical protein FHW37_1151 [Neorhizobium alkalisoli]
MASHNLLINLFGWRHRENVKPNENFLTEAFVHVLRMNGAFRVQFLADLVGNDVDPDVEIQTRSSYSSQSGTTIYPDIEISGAVAGNPFVLLIEVKWGSGYDAGQVSKYRHALNEAHGGGYVAFLCASRKDFDRAFGVLPVSPDRSARLILP